MAPEDCRFTDLLGRVLGPDTPAFALLYRPEAVGDRVELLLGDVDEVARLADVPLTAPHEGPPGPHHETLVLVPYRQVSERGFVCHDDGAPLLTLTVAEQAAHPLDEALALLPDVPVDLSDARFDVDDDEYASIVRRVLEREIGNGTGANFVISRSFTADITNWSPAVALSLFRRLLGGERGAYWTFVVHTGDRTFVGATPERHVSLFDGTAVMNPISGTLRYPPDGPALADVMRFLADPKEAGELYMVVDEELKMMARICDEGGRVVGPYLKEMATLAHTEYLIKGRTTRDVREILRETMFAPTVIGSPLESACRVIREYERRGRGYYSGVAALVSRDINGGTSLDSAILLRTAAITGGRLELAVGATLVRDSEPDSEVAETHAKARGVLRALGIAEPTAARRAVALTLADHPLVRGALEDRNESLARFWLSSSPADDDPPLTRIPEGRRVLVVDAEDNFTAMIAHLLRSLGFEVDVRRFNAPYATTGYDLVVMGPGPGDPCDITDARIRSLRETIRHLLDASTPFLAVCLSHQVLGTLLGLDIVRRERPNQGVQKKIELFGRPVLVGFYNTFALSSAEDTIGSPAVSGTVEVSRDPATGQVHGLRGPGFASLQFHPESLLSRDGAAVLGETVAALLAAAPHRAPAPPAHREPPHLPLPTTR
ncbi:anthranilate synthase family protein [Streptomyces sp. ISL-100]|uniref:anthranilate synthase family protein n=1 Tax=Streptomyces sp. ISL-100 TaxID=2819173 RepID=UPI001BEA1B96|nr:anthranilate synthase family protein [Streptomyces sp. ISL-100]MBT2399314.1 chorismate-binding protein [Streptomyces sp. ISL-100]